MDLYFYTHLEDDDHRKRVLALLDGNLILSDPSMFNDPFDTQLDIYYQFEDGDRLLPHSLDSCRMVCFSETWDSLLMWGHYARGHKGICLKLAVNRESLPCTEDVLEPVRYSSHYPKIRSCDFEEASDAWEAYLLTKSVDWLYEKEWRYVTSCFEKNLDSDTDYVRAESFLNVQAVYLGVEFFNKTLRKEEFLDLLCSKSSAEADDTIFDLLEKDDGAALNEGFFSENGENEAKKLAINHERFLMNLKRRNVPLFRCIKKKGMFGLELHPFEYGASVSRKISCLREKKKTDFALVARR